MDVIQYKCPNCGGDLQFDPASGRYTCEYCKSKFSQDDLDKQTAKKQAEDSSPASAESADHNAKSDELEDSRVYNCPSCGAQIVTDATTAATFCYYCHNPVVLSGRLDGKMKPDYIVPFKLGRKEALKIFEDWIKAHKYVPKEFYTQEQIDKFTGVYFPYLLYTCNIDGKIKAQAVKTSVYTEGNTEFTKTGNYLVERDGNMEIKHVMRNALKKANRVLSECVLPFEFEGIQPFNMSYLSGFMAEKRDRETSEFTEEVRTEVKDYAMSQLQASVAQYDNVTITSDNTKLVNEKWEYGLMPVWTLTYKDKSDGKIYYFSINGQTGKTVGELPVDKGKLFGAFLKIFIPICLALLAIFWFFFN